MNWLWYRLALSRGTDIKWVWWGEHELNNVQWWWTCRCGIWASPYSQHVYSCQSLIWLPVNLIYPLFDCLSLDYKRRVPMQSVGESFWFGISHTTYLYRQASLEIAFKVTRGKFSLAPRVWSQFNGLARGGSQCSSSGKHGILSKLN